MDNGYTNGDKRPLDDLAVFETASQSGPAAPARYAIRQALDQEYQKYLVKQNAAARLARYKAGGKPGDNEEIADDDKENVGPIVKGISKTAKPVALKRDFFGRIINEVRPISNNGSHEDGNAGKVMSDKKEKEDSKVWISFHEGFSNAVRKPMTLEELMRSF